MTQLLRSVDSGKVAGVQFLVRAHAIPVGRAQESTNPCFSPALHFSPPLHLLSLKAMEKCHQMRIKKRKKRILPISEKTGKFKSPHEPAKPNSTRWPVRFTLNVETNNYSKQIIWREIFVSNFWIFTYVIKLTYKWFYYDTWDLV